MGKYFDKFKNMKRWKQVCIGLFIIFIIVVGLAVISNMNHNSTDDNISPQEVKSRSINIDFAELNKNPSKFKGQCINISGKVVEIHEYKNSGFMRVAVNNNSDDIVYVIYNGTNDVLENNYITIYGIAWGTETYTSQAGYNITLPLVVSFMIEKH